MLHYLNSKFPVLPTVSSSTCSKASAAAVASAGAAGMRDGHSRQLLLRGKDHHLRRFVVDRWQPFEWLR